MKKLLKPLNPLIYLINLFMYMAHLENDRTGRNPESYNFSGDLKYF